MRREQIFKICLNFFLTDEIELKRKEDNSWTFAAADFSEGEFEPTSFAIRFKNKEIADGFKKAIDDALGCGNNDEKQDDEVDEKSQLVKRLLLPENFFDYLNSPDCPGCQGCKSESYDFSSNKKQEIANDCAPIPNEATMLKSKPKPRRQSVDKHVSFKLADEKEASENEKMKQLFGSGNVQEKTSVFGGGIKKSEGSANIFAAFTSENPAPTIFGTSSLPKPVFGFQNDATPISSIFSSSLNTTPAAATTADHTPFGKASESLSGGIFGSKTSFSFNSSSRDGDAGFFPKQNGDAAVNQFPAFSTTPIFGSSVFGSANNTAKADSTTSTPATANIFGGTSASTFSFANAARDLSMPKDSSQPASVIVPDFIQNSSDGGGFAALAATATPEKGWSANTSTTPTGGFFGLTVKNDFFSKNLNKNPDDPDTSITNEEGTNDENYDPHYEPIISLPDEINVSTGEEEEEKIFGDRAKLFRYDANTKEWKERGEFEGHNQKQLHQ